MHFRQTLRYLVFALLLLVAGATAYFLLFSARGHELLHDPHQFGAEVQGFVGRRPGVAVAGFFLVYLLLGLSMMPVWWVQVLAGYAFGVYLGTGYSAVAAGVTAVVTARTSRWLGGEALRLKAEARMAKLHAVMEALGRNGLLTVMAVRLAHVTPFGVSNHLFAVTPIRAWQIFVGSVTGGLPAIAFYVALGADRALLKDWRFWAVVVGTNVVLLLPLAGQWWWRRGKGRG